MELRAASYVRVSTEEQRDGTSLDVQRQLCVEQIARRGWLNVGAYADEGVSGILASRPALDDLVAACRRGEIDVVVVSRLDRFGRSLRHLTITLGELDDLGVQFVSVHEAFDSLGPAGRLQRNILSSVSQYEREQMLERSRTGLRAKAAAGWWPGGPAPFGFRLERVGRHLKLEIDEHEAHVIVRATELIVDEHRTHIEAAEQLNAEGLTPRKTNTWTYPNLRSHLLSAALSGTWRYGRGRKPIGAERADVVQVDIPRILTPERHRLLLERLRQSALGRQNPDHDAFYLLSRGILRCACGAICTGSTNYRYRRSTYGCVNRLAASTPRCRSPRVYAPPVEAHVASIVAAVLRAALTSSDTASPPATTERLRTLDARLHDAEVAVGRVAVALLGLDLPAEAIHVVIGELSGDLATLRAEKNRLETLVTTLSEEPARRHRLRELAQSLRVPFEQMSPWQQRPILEMLDVRVDISGWSTCARCAGNKRIATGSRGIVCPECHAVGQVPAFAVTGIWQTGR